MLDDFLLEIGTEELPSQAVWALSEALSTNMAAALNKAEISYGDIKTFATPRRIGLLISQLAPAQASKNIRQRGPALTVAYDKEGTATGALHGFAKSCGVSIEALSVEKTDKGSWLIYETMLEGKLTPNLLPELVKEALAALPIKKPMRWGEGLVEFVRPVHWLVMLLGDEVLPAEILNQPSGRLTYGHRFHAPEAIEISHPRDYEKLLEKAFVIADFRKRRECIVRQIEKAAEENKAKAIMPEELLDEVTSIVEWPEALIASFGKHFLEVPKEVLIASMQIHQKCFALEDEKGKLLPLFATVSNLKSRTPSQVVAGNEKVMRARLSDADFFFRQDKKNPLSHVLARTGQVVFQAKLGSLLDKSTRMQGLMASFAPIWSLDKHQAVRAAELSKCDLLTGMVGEFPELQGLMGYYYALHDGEEESVAKALYEQYLPRFSSDSLPTTAMGQALSVADRLDTLVGIFGLNLKPSGDKDPFKLRRHALALARMLMQNPKAISLSELIQQAYSAYDIALSQKLPEVIAELHPFVLERLQSFYQGEGIGPDIFQAVKACQTECLYDFDKRMKALAHFVNEPAAQSLGLACKRVNNLLRKEKALEATAINEGLLVEDAEKALFKSLLVAENLVAPLYPKADYALIFNQLATLKEPVDAFFDKVMVMVEDPDLQKNRLALLSRLKELLAKAVDMSLLQ